MVAAIFSQPNAELRLARYYASKLRQIYEQYQQGGAAITTALLAFDCEQAQILHWYGRIVKIADSSQLLDFARLLVEFVRYMLTVRQTLSERDEWLRSGLAAARKLADYEQEAFMLEELGYTASERGEFEKSHIYLDQSLQVALKSGNATRIMWAQIRLSYTAAVMGESDLAEAACQQAATSPANDSYATAIIYRSLAMIASQRGNFRQAIEVAEKALELFVQLGHMEKLGSQHYNLAIFYYELGDFDRVDYYSAKSLQLLRLVSNQAVESLCLMIRAYVKIALGLLDAAYHDTVEQEIIAHKLGVVRTDIYAHIQYGSIEHLRGNYLEAQRQYEIAHALIQPLQDRNFDMNLIAELLCLTLAMGDYAETAEYCDQMLAAMADPAIDIESPYKCLPHFGLGVIANSQGKFYQALDHFQKARALAANFKPRLIEIYAAMANSYLQMGDVAMVQQIVQQSEAEQKRCPYQLPHMTTIYAYQVRAALRAGALPQAQAALGAALQQAQHLELVLPRLHVIEAAAEYFAAVKDIRCVALFSFVSHHPASKTSKTMIDHVGAQHRQEIASDYGADTVQQYWMQGAQASLDELIKTLGLEFSQ